MPKTTSASDETTLVNPWPKRVIVRRGPNVAIKRSKDKEPLAARVKEVLSREMTPEVDLRPELTALRKRLAEAPDAEHAAARDAAAAFRSEPYFTRVACSFLFPSERAWVEADVADFAAEAKKKDGGGPGGIWRSNQRLLLLASLASFEDFLALVGKTTLAGPPDVLAVSRHDVFLGRWSTNYLATLLDGIGAGLLPLLRYYFDYSSIADVARAIAAIPTDEAMTLLVDRADDKHGMAGLTDAVAAFPVRAARVLGERVASKGKNHALVKPMIPTGAAAPETSAAEVPAGLASPPWAQKKGKAKAPAAIETRPLAYAPSMTWEPGERERFRESFLRSSKWDVFEEDAAKWKAKAATASEAEWKGLVDGSGYDSALAYMYGPKELCVDSIRKAIAEAAPRKAIISYLAEAIAQQELDILDSLVLQASTRAADVVPWFAPYDAPVLAPIVARLAHVKKLKAATEGWLTRHPRAAAVGLIPDAVGKAGAEKKAATATLQLLARSGHAGVVREVAAQYGAEVSSALEAIVGADPRLTKEPKAPSFWSPGTLPPILVGGAPLPAEALENLRVMLALNELDDPYPGLAEVLAACDRGSLAAFGWELFEAWQRAGSPAAERWALVALGVLGDDDTARKLAPLVAAWPGDGGHARAVVGLDVLRAIGSDVALTGVHAIAEHGKFDALQELAKKHIDAVAAARGLTLDELDDRLVPPVLDKVTKKSQLRRFERSMIAERRWSRADFEAYVVRPPAVGEIVRALVWGVFDAKNALVTTFRVAEDGTLADVKDAAFTLKEAAGHAVGIVHPLSLSDAELRAWGDRFGDYMLIQPFAQLQRGRFAGADVIAAIDGVKGKKVPTGKVLKLADYGWRRGEPQDSGHVGWMTRDTSIGTLYLHLEDGFIAGAIGESPEQTIGPLRLGRGADAIDATVVKELGAVEASELAHALSSITS
ncbi:MAG: DUF4132 domain-containing protein [Labilithrix sp.]|nr:DUF4132 domain-containing protein [Labilithrix sp.]MCW5817371.1 DUF4132 domain-containing protein [Labilithrix sp.]